VAWSQAVFLDLDLALGDFVFAEDDGEGDFGVVDFLELGLEFRFDFVLEFSLS